MGKCHLNKKINYILGYHRHRKALFEVKGLPMIDLFKKLGKQVTFYKGGSAMPDLSLNFEIFWPSQKPNPPWTKDKFTRKTEFGYGGIITTDIKEESIITDIPQKWFDKFDSAKQDFNIND